MKENNLYNYSIFIKEVNNQIKYQRMQNNKNILKALEDTFKALDSTCKLNQKESNEFQQILFSSLVASKIRIK